MKKAILGCRPLVTLAGPARPRVGNEMRELGIIPDGGMILEDGRIVAVGTREQIENQIDDQTQVEGVGGRLVMPGFVDAHAHPVFGENRAHEYEQRCEGASYQEIAAGGGGIQCTVRQTRTASEAELVAGGRRHIAWFLMNGTTTLEAKSGYGLTLDDELKMLLAIRRLGEDTPISLVPTFLGAHAVPVGSTAEAYADLVINEMLPAVVAENLAEYADAFCEVRYFTPDLTRRIMSAAKKRGLGLRLHVDQLTNGGGAALAAELGAITADHLEHTEAEGIAAMAKAGTIPVLLPGSVYALGLQRYPQARAMIEAGLPVVLATDFNPGSSPTPSMPMVMSLACTQMKMTPSEALVASTINAAYSLNRGHDRGSLEVGKRADFVVFDATDPREVPYWFGAHLVRQTWIQGQRLYTCSIS